MITIELYGGPWDGHQASNIEDGCTEFLVQQPQPFAFWCFGNYQEPAKVYVYRKVDAYGRFEYRGLR